MTSTRDVVVTVDDMIAEGHLSRFDDDVSDARFQLGEVVATAGVQAAISHDDLKSCLRRHAAGDWGDLDADDQDEDEEGPSDRELNDRALVRGGRLHSLYCLGDATLWIITEHDRSVTTLLLPSEY